MSKSIIPIASLLADPDAALKAARLKGAVAETEVGTMIVRHDAVRTVGQSDKLKPGFTQVLATFGVTSGPFFDWISISPLDMDGEKHRAWRQLMQRTFTPRSVERLRPSLRSESERLSEQLLALGLCDFIAEFARKLPSFGLCELIGVPREDRERFMGWADTIGFGFNVTLLPTKIGEIDAALSQLLAYAAELVAARRKEPRDDLVTRIAQAADEESGFDEDEIVGSVAGLVFAGHETTKNQLGWMIAVLSEVPAEWERVASEPDRARDVIEEVLRFRSTATNFARIAREDVVIGGETIAKDSLVMASIWAANRDPAEFPKPDEFAVDDNRSGVQLAFGQGAHHCLGAALARAELQEALIALARAMTCPKLEPGATFLPPIGINGPSYLPIRCSRR
jgi:cytochrome P450